MAEGGSLGKTACLFPLLNPQVIRPGLLYSKFEPEPEVFSISSTGTSRKRFRILVPLLSPRFQFYLQYLAFLSPPRNSQFLSSLQSPQNYLSLLLHFPIFLLASLFQLFSLHLTQNFLQSHLTLCFSLLFEISRLHQISIPSLLKLFLLFDLKTSEALQGSNSCLLMNSFKISFRLSKEQ